MALFRQPAHNCLRMACKRKAAVALLIATMILLTNRLLFFVWDGVSESQADHHTEATEQMRLTKQRNLATINRISANFAPFKNKYMDNFDTVNINPNQKYDYIKIDLQDTKGSSNITSNVVIEREQEQQRPLKITSEKDSEEENDNYKLYLSLATSSDLTHPYVNQHKYEYPINNRAACNGRVFVLIIIHSAPEKLKERMAIRTTWGSVRFYSGVNIVPVFMLAKQKDDANNTMQAQLEEEHRVFSDIVQGNFIDSYRNLTCKAVMGLHWTQTFCNHTNFVLKVDDDTMVDVFHLVKFLLQKSPDGNVEDFLYCSVFKNQGPVRRTSDKWFVPNHEYPYSKYPPYCEGFAYIMSNDVTKSLYAASKSVKFYWIDDVYITGLVALQARIIHREMERGHAYNLLQEEHLSKNVQSSMFLLAKYDHFRQNWYNAWNDIKTLHNVTDIGLP